MSIGISPKQHQPRTADKQTVMRAQGQFFNGTQLVVLVVVLAVVAICGPCADAAAAATPHFSSPPNSHDDGASSSGCCHAETHVCNDKDDDIPLRLLVAHRRPGLAVKTSRSSSSSSSIFRRKANAVAVSLRGGGGGNTQSRATTTTTAAAASRCRRSNSLPTTVTTSVTAAADGSPAGTLTSNRAVINLVKSIVGAAVFGLPAGVAASFGHHAAAPSAIWPALLLLVTIGTWAAYGFDCIGTVCRVSGATSYTQAWSRTVGTKSSWMPATACFMVTVCTVLTYSVILADTIPAIVESTMASSLLVSTSTTVQWWSMGRTSALLSVTLLIVYPLCRLQSLAALAPFSFLGILGMLFTGLCMAIRYLSGAYAPHGHFATQVAPHLYEPNCVQLHYLSLRFLTIAFWCILYNFS
jgi:hypothetical protein